VIVVLGAGGGVGGALAAELDPAGSRLCFRDPERVAAARAAGRDAVRVEYTEPDTLSAALTGADAVFLVGSAGLRQAEEETGVVAAAVQAGVPRLVKLSVWRAPEELSPFARTHRAVELAVEASGLAWTFLRPNFYMQNFTRQFAPSIREHDSFAQPETSAAISFVDTRDVARAAAVVLRESGHESQSYDLSGPAALTYREAAAVLSEVLGREIRFTELTDEDARAGMIARGLPEFHADYLIGVARAYRDGGAERVTSTITDLTGVPPRSFADFIRDHAAYFRP
jgi:uncharacterized protein YbjT (DUF2867 family)